MHDNIALFCVQPLLSSNLLQRQYLPLQNVYFTKFLLQGKYDKSISQTVYSSHSYETYVTKYLFELFICTLLSLYGQNIVI